MNFRIQVHAYVIQFFFGLIKTHILYLIQIVLMVVTLQKFRGLIEVKVDFTLPTLSATNLVT